jgi:hypothetical protein
VDKFTLEISFFGDFFIKSCSFVHFIQLKKDKSGIISVGQPEQIDRHPLSCGLFSRQNSALPNSPA